MTNDKTSPVLRLPNSIFLHPTSGPILEQALTRAQPLEDIFRGIDIADLDSVRDARGPLEQHWAPLEQRFRQTYDVSIDTRIVAGVPVEIIEPGRASTTASTRILINLHGGGFLFGDKIGSHIESIPIAGLTGMSVFGVLYRLAPEHKFPAATDDVVAVYRELLRDYAPGSIGIFGCSAGALLTTQTIARLLHEGLPLPGAIALLSGAGAYFGEGDSGYFNSALTGRPIEELEQFGSNPYLSDETQDNPLAFPTHAPAVLAKFPPTLLLTSTRDQCLSSCARTHMLLREHDVPSDLFVWDGLGHAFMCEPDLPESRQAHELISRFFNRWLC